MMVKASPIRLLRCCSILCHRGIAESYYLRSDDLGGGRRREAIQDSVHLDTIFTSCLCFAHELQDALNQSNAKHVVVQL